MRSTTASPSTEGNMETRISISRFLIRTIMRAVLRQALLGDVEVCKDLDARDDRGVELLGRRHHGTEVAVDSETDQEVLSCGSK